MKGYDTESKRGYTIILNTYTIIHGRHIWILVNFLGSRRKLVKTVCKRNKAGPINLTVATSV